MPTIDGTTTGETPEQRRIRLGLLPDRDFTPEEKEVPVTYKHSQAAGKVVATLRAKK